MTLGERIAELRKERHMSQEELGHRTGHSQGQICRIESGADLKIMRLACIAKVLNAQLMVDLVPLTSNEDALDIARAQRSMRP